MNEDLYETSQVSNLDYNLFEQQIYHKKPSTNNRNLESESRRVETFVSSRKYYESNWQVHGMWAAHNQARFG
jgi:hypothetical protein